VFAKISDTIGKVPVMVVATSLIGGAMATLPYCCGMVGSNTGIEEAQAMMPLFYMTLGLWSVGSSMLSTAPLAYVTDRVGDQQRAQAIALMRTCGDVGFLLGATSTGWLADWTGSLGVAMQSSAGVLLSATVWFAIRQMFLNTSHFRNRGNTSMANVKQ
jgi:MFS family permease